MAPRALNRRTVLWAICCILVLLTGGAGSARAAKAPWLSGWVLWRAGYGLNSDNYRLVLNQQLLQVGWEPPAVQGWRLHVEMWGEIETQLEPRTYADLSLRELTLRRETSAYTLTLGRQIVVWGKADGFRLLDIVNPLDLREFVLGNTLRSRLPLWMANVQLYPDENQQLQLLLIPETYEDRVAPRGSEFDFTALAPPGAEILPINKPADEPQNWSFGSRWSISYGNWDIDLVGIRNLTGAPVEFTSLKSNGLLQIRPKVVERTVFGAYADWNAGPAVVRMEFAASPDEYRSFTSPNGVAYLKRETTFRTLLGIDWYVHNLLISPQFFDVEGPGKPGIIDDPDGRYVSLLLRRKFYYDKLGVKLFAASALSQSDYWIGLRVQYDLRQNLVLTASADWLGGVRDGFFGQFGDRDRIVLGAKVFF